VGVALGRAGQPAGGQPDMTADTTTLPPAEPDLVSGAPPHPLREFWRYFSANAGAVAGLAIIVIVLLLALCANIVAPHAPNLTHDDAFLRPPFWQEGGSLTYPLGTDAIGRDILSRLIHGARLSLTIGMIVVSLSLAFGIVLGLVAGFFRGVIEIAIMRLMDVILTLPSLLLAIVIVAILGPGLSNAMIAVAIVVLPHYVRITRAAVIGERAKDYVMASKVAGAGTLRLMFATVLPNCTAPLIVQASLGFSVAILDAAALGFLGLGAQPPQPEWGTMLADAREFVLRAWWVVTFPGLAILITVLAFNLLGDGLRDAFDPKLKR
jgi:dipeptide transport system permease protein